MLIFESSTFADVLKWVQNDPMIIAGLVDWQVQEWIPVSENYQSELNEIVKSIFSWCRP